MKELTIARPYALALMKIGKENKLDVISELTNLTIAINSSNAFENVLFLGVFTTDERKDVFNAIAKKMKLSNLTINFINFLIEENRISILPLIYKEAIVIDDHERGFMRGTIEGGDDSLSEDTLSKLKNFLETKLGFKTDLVYKKNQDLTAGLKVTVEDLQLDATLDNQLQHFKNSLCGE